MNLPQGLRTREQYCVSLKRPAPVARERVLGTFDYAHPGYTFASIGTRPGLRVLHGANRTHFCGSYHGFGFHEDAVRSAPAPRASSSAGTPRAGWTASSSK